MLVLTHGRTSVFPMDLTDSGRLLKVLFTLPVSSFGQNTLDSRFCPLESSREYWTCVVFLGENQLARKCKEPNRIKSCGKTQRIKLVLSVLHFVAGSVRHEIRPIRMRYLWSDFRAWKEPFSEVYMMTFSLYSKLVWVISTLYLLGMLFGHFILIVVTLVFNILLS